MIYIYISYIYIYHISMIHDLYSASKTIIHGNSLIHSLFLPSRGGDFFSANTINGVCSKFSWSLVVVWSCFKCLDLSNLWMLMKKWSFFGFGGSFLMFWMEYERFETMETEKNRGEPSCWICDNSSNAISQWLSVIYRLKQPMPLGYFKKKKTYISKRHLRQIQNIIKHMCFFGALPQPALFCLLWKQPKISGSSKNHP